MVQVYAQLFTGAVISVVLLLVLFVLSKSGLVNSSKSSPFECGFWPCQSSRLPFSLQFFLIALVFLVFDVELIFLFPVLLSEYHLLHLSSWGFLLFICLVGGGLLLEWSQGSLEWIK